MVLCAREDVEIDRAEKAAIGWKLFDYMVAGNSEYVVPLSNLGSTKKAVYRSFPFISVSDGNILRLSKSEEGWKEYL